MGDIFGEEMRTDKNDWLLDRLKKSSNFFVSDVPSLILIGNRSKNNIPIYLLCIDLKRNTMKLEEQKDLIRKIEEFFDEFVHVILWDDEKWYMYDKDFKKKEINLKNYFKEIDPKLVVDVGTNKPVFDSTGDKLHEWIRENISKFVSVVDVDAMSFKNKTIYELKRIKDRLELWRPYLNEKSNFSLVRRICKMKGIRDILICYEKKREKAIGYHILNHIGKNDKLIKGKRLFYEDGKKSNFKEYSSDNFRVKRY
jgi:hypothetical protein